VASREQQCDGDPAASVDPLPFPSSTPARPRWPPRHRR
jgi:hypothetical protein